MLGAGTRVSPLAPLDARQQRRHKLRNLAQSAILLGGMVGLLALCGWMLFGPDGVVGMALGSALALAFSPKISPALVLRLYRARELGPHELPEVFAVLDRLTRRAGLRHRPKLLLHPEPDAERVRGRPARRCGDRADRRHAAHALAARAGGRAGPRDQPRPQQRSVADGARRPGRPADPRDGPAGPRAPGPGDPALGKRGRPACPGS